MARFPLLLTCVIVLAGLAAMTPARAATLPIDYSDPASDVVQLNATTNLCVVDAGGTCILSPDPADMNILWLRAHDAGADYNFTIQVKGHIRDAANTSYVVNFYDDPTNRTHWIVNYTNSALHLYTNASGASRTNLTGNTTVWGPNPGNLNAVSMFVNKTLVGPANASASVNVDATAIMRGDPALGQKYSYQDFGWEVPGHPASSPTLLKGHVYVRGTTTGIAGATVAVGGQSVATNATGYYEVALSPGTYNVTVSADGYVTATSAVTLTLGQTVTHDVELDRTLTGTLGAFALWIALAVLALVVILILVMRSRRKKKGVRVA